MWGAIKAIQWGHKWVSSTITINQNLHTIQPIIVQLKSSLKLPFRQTMETHSINQRSSPSLTSLARAPARHIIIGPSSWVYFYKCGINSRLARPFAMTAICKHILLGTNENFWVLFLWHGRLTHWIELIDITCVAGRARIREEEDRACNYDLCEVRDRSDSDMCIAL